MYIYILKSKSQPKTYVGITNNLDRRLIEHNSRCDKYTSKFKPWEIIYSEWTEGVGSARERERYFKSCAGRKQIRSILDNREPASTRVARRREAGS